MKRILWCAPVACCALFVSVVVIERVAEVRSPSLDVLAHRAPSVGLSMSFSYPRTVLNYLNGLAKDLGVLPHFQTLVGISERTPLSKMTSKMGAQGFVTLDIDSNIGGIFLRRVDNLVVAYMTALEEYETNLEEDSSEEGEEVEPYEFEEPQYDAQAEITPEEEEESEVVEENLLSDPLNDVIESAWNGGFLTVGSAVKFDLSYLEKLRLTAGSLFSRNDAVLKKVLIRSLPFKLQQYLATETLGLADFHTEHGSNSGVNHGTINLSAPDIEALFEGLCPENSVGWDGCSMFGLDREYSRTLFANVLYFVDEDFEIQLDFFWALRGSTLVWSNKAAWVEATLGNENYNPGERNNPLASVDNKHSLFVASPSAENESVRFSVGADYKRLQDDLLQMLALLRANIRRESLGSIDLLSTPKADEWLNSVEDYAVALPENSAAQCFEVILSNKTLTSSLWSKVSFEDEKEEKKFATESTNQLFSIIKRMLVAKSALSKSTMIPFDEVQTAKAEDWHMVETSLSTSAISPLVQRRMRAINKDSRGIF